MISFSHRHAHPFAQRVGLGVSRHAGCRVKELPTVPVFRAVRAHHFAREHERFARNAGEGVMRLYFILAKHARKRHIRANRGTALSPDIQKRAGKFRAQGGGLHTMFSFEKHSSQYQGPMPRKGSRSTSTTAILRANLWILARHRSRLRQACLNVSDPVLRGRLENCAEMLSADIERNSLQLRSVQRAPSQCALPPPKTDDNDASNESGKVTEFDDSDDLGSIDGEGLSPTGEPTSTTTGRRGATQTSNDLIGLAIIIVVLAMVFGKPRR